MVKKSRTAQKPHHQGSLFALYLETDIWPSGHLVVGFLLSTHRVRFIETSTPVKNLIKKYDYNITGASGEFFVAAELSRRGIIATLTVKNAPLVDVIAMNLANGKTANIQVKTRSERNKQGWLLNSKVENISSIKNHFYVFVYLYSIHSLPEYYIIPFNLFAKYQHRKHLAWLGKNDRNGIKHKNNNHRNFKPSNADRVFAKKYLNNWNMLGITNKN